mmetsp:Transcript_10605/g.35483  ORF Transcript_10605/g.35483 Transcript_10605/m.35483 type:complete len:137 (+) Transcript_10605:706-1116(+)
MHENLQWKAISCGTSHTCAILKNGSAACWGSNVEGQISIPPQVAAWEMIDCGYAHTCGIDVNGSAYCWGWDGITPGRLIPFGQTKVSLDERQALAELMPRRFRATSHHGEVSRQGLFTRELPHPQLLPLMSDKVVA